MPKRMYASMYASGNYQVLFLLQFFLANIKKPTPATQTVSHRCWYEIVAKEQYYIWVVLLVTQTGTKCYSNF